MIKLVLSVALLAAMQAAPPIPRQATDSQTSKKNSVSGNADKKPQNPSAVTPAPSPSAETSKDSARHGAQENKKVSVDVGALPDVTIHKDAWDHTYIVLTGILVFVTCLTLAAIWYQARQTAISAKAMRDQTAAFIDSERAWLVPVVHRFSQIMNGVDETKLDNRLALPFVNCGRTPAWVVEWSRNVKVSESAEIPQPLDYGLVDRDQNGAPFPVGEPYGLDFYFDWNAKELSEVGDVTSGRKHLHIYGFVKYRDISNVVRETRFCFSHSVSEENLVLFVRTTAGWRTSGPAEANNYA